MPPPPIQLPHSAPSAFHEPAPKRWWNIAYETKNPSPIDNVAAKKPISILGPSLMIFFKSQRSSIMKSIAYNIGFLTDLYTALVALRSHTFIVQRSISPRYISTIGGAKLKNTCAFFPLKILGRFTNTAAANISAARYKNPSFIMYKFSLWLIYNIFCPFFCSI